MDCVLHQDSVDRSKNQRRVFFVVSLTLAMMLVEISTGLIFGSMALLADGIHMGTHFFALSITLIAYAVAKKHSKNEKFVFGTGKISSLGGFTSAVVLLISALGMIFESVSRFFDPIEIDFNQSIMVAIIGLVVNVFCAFLLNDSHSHSHHHGEHHHHHDHNLKAAYLHVVADALTSLLAITALFAAKYMNWVWCDPLVGIVGGFVVIKWGIGLLKETGSVLLDFEGDGRITKTIQTEFTTLVKGDLLDLHVWRIDENRRALICKFDKISDSERTKITSYLEQNKEIVHFTIDSTES